MIAYYQDGRNGFDVLSFCRLPLIAVVFFSLFLNSPISQAQVTPANTSALVQVGEIALTKGVVTARSPQRSLTALAKGSPVYLGDNIETASRSFTVIKFNDNGKVTLRPESSFEINEYNSAEGQEKQSFELLKGGLRAVTGAIGKANPEQVSYKARNTTIGIRGTTFLIKLCEEGVDGCQFTKGINDQTDIASEDQANESVDIFVVDRNGGSRERITREQLRELLNGVYVAVIDGSIRVTTRDWFVDLTAGEKCLIDFDTDKSQLLKNNQELECFIHGRGIESIDVFLRGDTEEITNFNLFDDAEIFAGNEICEIN